jgi:hypothetical protein
MNNIFVTCLHYSDFILIEQINCAIFRHVILKSNGHQLINMKHKKIVII